MTGITANVYKNFQGSNLSDKVCEENLRTVMTNVDNLLKMRKIGGGGRDARCSTVIVRYILSHESVEEFIPYIDYWRARGADAAYVTGLGAGVLKSETRPLGKIVAYRPCCRFGQVIVQATGDVLLSCCDYKMESVGNVYERSFYDIMKSEEVVRYEKAHKELSVNEMPGICKNCRDIHVYEESKERDGPLHEQYRNKILDMARGKKLVVWGSGAEYEVAKKSYIHDLAAAYIVDNNPERWGKVVDGTAIKPPDALKDEDAGNIFVLVASSHFFKIQEHLLDLGIDNYYPTPLLLDRYVEKEHINAIPFITC